MQTVVGNLNNFIAVVPFLPVLDVLIARSEGGKKHRERFRHPPDSDPCLGAEVFMNARSLSNRIIFTVEFRLPLAHYTEECMCYVGVDSSC